MTQNEAPRRRAPLALPALLLALLGVLAPGREAGAQEAKAQEAGRVMGRVVEAATGKAIAGAQVALEDGTRGALTDLDGRYLIQGVPAGAHTLVARMLGYAAKRVTGVAVPAQGAATLDIALTEAAVEVAGITVTAERERGSSAYLMDERRTAEAMVEAVGAAEISRRPDGDAAEVAKRMTGVTVADGKYVFVRGLGERYSQTSFNGSPMASPEPEKEVVPLDIIPAGVLESLTTQKSYTPDRPADFAGGAVDIKTKDFPSAFTFRLGLSTSFNSMSQFRDGFLHYPGGGLDFVGFDDGTRAIPAGAQSIIGGIRGDRIPADAGVRAQLAGEFPRRFSPVPGPTPLNRSVDFSLGGRSGVGGAGELGYFLAGTYSDEYAIRDREVERKYRTSAFDPVIPAELRGSNVDYAFNRGVRTVSWGTVGNVTWKIVPTQKISLRTTATLNTEDEARIYQGSNSEDLQGNVRSERLRFVQRLMLWSQLSGEHAAPLDSRVEWRLTGSRSHRDEPALRETLYLQSGAGEPFYLEHVGESGRVFYSDLVETDRNAELDWSVPFPFIAGDATLKLGGQWRERDRDFGARRFAYDFLGGFITDLDAALQEATFVGTPRNPGEFSISDVVEPGDVYAATDRRQAGYAMVTLPLTSRLQAVTGARVESYRLDLSSRGESIRDRSQVDVAPSLNLVYTASDRVKLRAAVAQTVDRPEFRELAPFQFTEATSLRQIFGNPELESATIRSADLRADWFPAAGAVLSAGIFYKELDRPIEQVYVAAASSAFSYQNANRATVRGVELEAQSGLGFLASPLAPFQAQANASFIASSVSVRSAGTFNPTNLERPLEGQAPYVLNLGLGYRPGAWEAGVYYNRFGERLTAAGGSGIPDIYEQPRNQLDATLSFPFPRGGRLKIKGTNLLDDRYRFTQSANGITLVQRQYWTGRTVSVGLSWEL